MGSPGEGEQKGRKMGGKGREGGKGEVTRTPQILWQIATSGRILRAADYMRQGHGSPTPTLQDVFSATLSQEKAARIQGEEDEGDASPTGVCICSRPTNFSAERSLCKIASKLDW